MSRHFNSAQAFCLFGDRIPREALQRSDRHPELRAFSEYEDVNWLARVAAAADITLRIPY